MTFQRITEGAANRIIAQTKKEIPCPKCNDDRQVEVFQYLLKVEAHCDTCSHTWKLG